MNDTQLLQCFVDGGSEGAFRGLVERHLPLVLGTARRLVSDSALAEDVAQTVFILLARKAGSFSSTTILPSWLYRTTCFVAKRAMTSEGRRRSREEQAVLMQEHNTDSDAGWEQIAPQLDYALQRLGEVDRSAILLRYINQQSTREVGLELGLSEEAAKKRIARALEKLRALLARRGVQVSAAALILGLSQRATHAAPAASVTSISHAALQTAAGATGASALLLKASSALRWAKLKVVLVGGAAVALLFLTVQKSPLHRWLGLASVARGSVSQTNRVSQGEMAAMAGRSKATKGTDASGADLHLLKITVLDAQTKQPIEGAEMLQPDFNSPLLNDLRTDSNGIVTLQLPRHPAMAERMMQFAIFVKTRDYAQREIMWLSTTGNVFATISNDYTVQLERGITIAGIVVDDAEQPVAGLRLDAHGSNYRGYTTHTSNGVVTSPPEVWAEDFSTCSISAQATNSPVIVTDKDGRFRIDNYPADLRQLEIVVYSPDGNRTKFRTMSAEKNTEFPASEISFEDLKHATARLVVKRGVQVDGVVVDHDGNPIAGATVLEATQWGNLKIHSTNVTDAVGQFHLTNRPAREFIFSASKEGYGSASTIATVCPGMSQIKVELPPELPLRGRVVNESGQPQSGLQVKVVDYLNEGLGFAWTGTTEADGRFVWSGAPTNALDYVLLGNGILKIVRMTASTNEHLITSGQSKSEVEAEAKVFDAETRAPIEKFHVSVSHTELGASTDEFTPSVDGVAGAFALKIPFSDFQLGQAPVWTLKVEADGYQPSLSHSFGFDEGDQNLEFALMKSYPLHGTVTTPQGDPASGATIVFAAANDAIFSSIPGNFAMTRPATGRTDANGHFKVSPPLKASAMGIFHKSGWTVQAIATNDLDARIVLKPWGRIEGTVVRDGVPGTNQQVVVQRLMWDLAEPLNIHYYTTTDAEGHFVFEKMPSGEYQLGLESDDWKDVRGSYVQTLQTPVTVQAGETANAVIQSAGTSVSMQLQLPAELGAFSNSTAVATLSVNVNVPPQPPRDNYVTEQSHHKARLDYAHDPVVLAATRRMRTFGGHVSLDGIVCFDDIPPGSYVFEVTLFRGLEPGQRRVDSPVPQTLAKLRTIISVPETSVDQQAQKPVSLGSFTLEPL